MATVISYTTNYTLSSTGIEKCIPISHVTLETVPKYANIERPTSSQLYASLSSLLTEVVTLYLPHKIILECYISASKNPHCNAVRSYYKHSMTDNVIQVEVMYSSH